MCVLSIYTLIKIHGKQKMKKVEAMTDFLFLGSKITADGDCSLEIRRHLLLGRKAMTNPQQTLSSILLYILKV